VGNSIKIDHREIVLGVGGLDSTGTGQRPLEGCCECGDVPSFSCATELARLYSVDDMVISV
jgi:hypothetical protein